MLRWILCHLGMHHQIRKVAWHYPGQPETTFEYWCTRIGCKWRA